MTTSRGEQSFRTDTRLNRFKCMEHSVSSIELLLGLNLLKWQKDRIQYVNKKFERSSNETLPAKADHFFIHFLMHDSK